MIWLRLSFWYLLDLDRKLQKCSDQNLLDMEEVKKKGRKVIGFYCLYSPVELAVAAGAIPVSKDENAKPKSNWARLIKKITANVPDMVKEDRSHNLVPGHRECGRLHFLFDEAPGRRY